MTDMRAVIIPKSDEEWRLIADFPDYAVSSEGRVKRVVPDRHGRMGEGGLRPVVSNHGYEVVSLHRDGAQSVRLVHRIVCEAFHGPPPKGAHAAHYDGDKRKNRADNLRWSSPSENNLDKHRHGTMLLGDRHPARIRRGDYLPRGSNHAKAKLTEEAVRRIRADSRSQRLIAADYGVAQSLISQVRSGKIWGHVQEEPAP